MKRAVPVLCALFAAACLLSPKLERSLAAGIPQNAAHDPLTQMLGSATEIAGDAIYIKSDAYFHGGMGEERLMSAREEDAHEEGAPSGFAPPPKDWVERVNRHIQVTEHRHLEGAQAKEMLPLLYWSTTLDPHNVTAILTTAFWLDRQFGKVDEALRLLEKAAADNPGSWEIAYERAKLVFERKKVYAQAVELFQPALALMGDRAELVNERRTAYYFSAQSYEALGRRAEALRAYQAALALIPNPESTPLAGVISKKISELSLS